MAIFEFNDDALFLGTVREVDTRKVSIHVKNDTDLRKAKVGQLVCLPLATGVDTWLIGIIGKVIKSVAPSVPKDEFQTPEEGDEEYDSVEEVLNTVRLTLVGTTRWHADGKKYIFSRSLVHVPEIESRCYVLREAQLETFMNILVASGDKEQSLAIGKYAIDESATAYLDGNKFFQRHAALLGSTGSGKSWTVASILERAAKLSSSNLIVFDLHGEYCELSYARHLRVPGPDDSGSSKNLLYLPYWLLNSDEMQAMFVDRSEFSAHNQVMAFQDAVIDDKREVLHRLDKTEVLNAFTLDSPLPFSIENVYAVLKRQNEEMVQGARGLKQGNFFGQFSRLLTRIRSKLNDKRYGFLFHAPEAAQDYDYMAALVERLMNFKNKNSRIKVIDFSEVPSEILPIIVGLVARIVYQVQFWTSRDKRRPLALVCDEAHLYVPKKEDRNPVEIRAIEAFEKIAKEGRKYGVALLVVSQRPSDVSPTVLSQCNNVVSMRLTNGDDQSTVKKLMPENLEGLLDVLPIMDIGEALVVGDAVLLPSRVKVTEPKEKPLSATVDFWSEWRMDMETPDFERAVENMRRQRRT